MTDGDAGWEQGGCGVRLGSPGGSGGVEVQHEEGGRKWMGEVASGPDV
jgi:hypothetical protein